MKLALVAFHDNISEHTIGGCCTIPIYLQERLQAMGIESDIIVSGKSHKHSGFTDKVHHYLNSEDGSSEYLNQYDFIIFMTMGLTYEKYSDDKAGHNYDYILKGLTTPFAMVVNEERDREIYPYYTEFTNHEMLRFVMFNSIDMHEDFTDLYEKCKDYVEFNFYLTMPSLEEVLEKHHKKRNVLISTARWGNRKRVVELARLAPEIVEKSGVEVRLAGAQQNYFYSKVVNETNPESWTNVGYYTPDQLPEILSECKYHYNFVYLARKNRNRHMRDRIELSTQEALREGCLPIICSDTSPKWLSQDDGICITSKQLSDLPEILRSMTDEESSQRISNFYNTIHDHFIPQYEVIVSKIKEYVSHE